MDTPSDGDRTDPRESEAERGYLNDWIENIATTESMDPMEVVEQLVSSYWTMKEMSAIIGDADGPVAAEPSEGASRTAGSYQEALAELTERVGALESSVDPAATERLREDLADLEGRLGSLESSVDPAETERLREDLADLEGRLGDLESSVDPGATERFRSDLEAIREDLRGALAGVRAELAGVEVDLQSRQTSIESRLDDELEHLQDILEFLVERADGEGANPGELARLRRSYRDLTAERDRLARLLAEADRLGVSRATCGGCGDAVDLRLLTSPACPHCHRRVTDVDHEDRWFGRGTTTLSVRAEPDESETGASRGDADAPSAPAPEVRPSEGDDGPGAGEDGPIDGFRWGEDRD